MKRTGEYNNVYYLCIKQLLSAEFYRYLAASFKSLEACRHFAITKVRAKAIGPTVIFRPC